MRALSNWMGPFDTPTIARYASDVITKTNWDKQNRMVEDLTLLQVHEQVFLKQFLKQKFGVQFLPISLRSVMLMLSDSPWVPIICILFLHFSCFIVYFSQNLTVLEIAPRSINKKFGSILSGIIRPEAQQIPLELQNCVSFKKSCCT